MKGTCRPVSWPRGKGRVENTQAREGPRDLERAGEVQGGPGDRRGPGTWLGHDCRLRSETRRTLCLPSGPAGQSLGLQAQDRIKPVQPVREAQLPLEVVGGPRRCCIGAAVGQSGLQVRELRPVHLQQPHVRVHSLGCVLLQGTPRPLWSCVWRCRLRLRQHRVAVGTGSPGVRPAGHAREDTGFSGPQTPRLEKGRVVVVRQ